MGIESSIDDTVDCSEPPIKIGKCSMMIKLIYLPYNDLQKPYISMPVTYLPRELGATQVRPEQRNFRHKISHPASILESPFGE